MMPPPSQPLTPYAEGISMSPGDGLQYRGGSSYGFGGKSCYQMPGFGGAYSEEAAVGSSGVEYAMCQAPYPSIQDPSYMMSYRLGSNGGAAKTENTMYLESEPGYGYGSGGSAAPSLGHQPAQPGDSSNYQFQRLTASMAASLSGPDRQLPAPTRRPLPSSAPRPYRADSVSSAYSKHSGGTSPPGIAPEPHSTYSSAFDSSPVVPSYAAATAAAGSHGTSSSRHNDMYTTSTSSTSHSLLGGGGGGGGGGSAPDRMADSSSAPEMHYRYYDTTRRDAMTGGGGGGLAMAAGSQPYLPSLAHAAVAGPYVDLGGAATEDAVADDDRKPVNGLRA